ncbi:MAG: SPASM domain-containing protein [Caulobacteraceae bacterium]
MYHLVVDSDGQILICCNDFRRAEGIGDLRRQSFAEALTCIQRWSARNMLREKRHSELATCSRCYADLPEAAETDL